LIIVLVLLPSQFSVVAGPTSSLPVASVPPASGVALCFLLP
jgi:hypothetical protein